MASDWVLVIWQDSCLQSWDEWVEEGGVLARVLFNVLALKRGSVLFLKIEKALKAEKVYLCYKDERWKERKGQKTRKSEIEKNGKQPTTWAPSLVECKKNGLHVKLHCLLPSLWPAPHKSLYLLGHASCAPSLVELETNHEGVGNALWFMLSASHPDLKIS